MVVMDKVQETMDKKSFEFVMKGSAVFRCLSLCFMEIDYDIP